MIRVQINIQCANAQEAIATYKELMAAEIPVAPVSVPQAKPVVAAERGGPNEQAYKEKFGKRLRLSEAEMSRVIAGEITREGIAAERLATGDVVQSNDDVKLAETVSTVSGVDPNSTDDIF